MADFPKLSDLPDDMTIGEFKRLSTTGMLTDTPLQDAMGSFTPRLGQTYANAREPSLREQFVDVLTPFSPGPVAGASPLADTGGRDAYRAAEAGADNPIASFGLDLLQGGKEFWEGSPGKGLGRIVGGSSAVEGNPWFDEAQIATEETPGFMDAQAKDRKPKPKPQAPLGPKALRAQEAGRGDADATRTKAASDAKIAEENAAAAREMQNKKDSAAFDAAESDRKARTPFRQNHPIPAGALHFIPSVIAASGGLLARRGVNRGIEEGAERLAKLVDDFTKARAAGDLEGATLAKMAIEGEQNALKAATGLKETAKGYGSAAFGGGLLNMGGATLPEGYDMAQMPEGPERQRAKDRILSAEGLQTLGMRFGTGALAGAGGYWGTGAAKAPDVMSKASAATAYGTPKFDEALEGLANTGRQASMQGAANKITSETADDMVRLESPIGGGKLKSEPEIKPMLDPSTKGKELTRSTKASPETQAKYAANQSKIKELETAVAKEEAAVAKPRNRVKISDLRAEIQDLKNENLTLRATVEQQMKDAKKITKN